MKDLKDYLFEGKRVVKNNELVDKNIQQKIINNELSWDEADDIVTQYKIDFDEVDSFYIDEIDRMSMEVDPIDYINGELKGSIAGQIDEIIDALGVDKWYLALNSILNKQA